MRNGNNRVAGAYLRNTPPARPKKKSRVTGKRRIVHGLFPRCSGPLKRLKQNGTFYGNFRKNREKRSIPFQTVQGDEKTAKKSTDFADFAD
jgi:hypothetical protein